VIFQILNQIRNIAESAQNSKSTDDYLADAGFQKTVEKIVNDTLFGLIGDLSKGEFRLDAPPKQVIVKGLLFE
jgi:hypothetical protein